MLLKYAVGAAALALGAGAIAQPDGSATSPATEQVTYGDLNLASPSGETALLRRIRTAANRVCDAGGMQAMSDFEQWGRCYRAAVQDGRAQMQQIIASRRIGGTLAASTLVISGSGAR